MSFLALTLYQPWATAIVRGAKTIENRGWSTDYRGLLLIHAGKKWDADGAAWIYDTFDLEFGADTSVRGAIVGAVDLVEVTSDPEEADPWAFEGSYHWRLGNAIAFETPIPMRGKLGLWSADPSAILPQLTHEESRYLRRNG